MDIEAYINVIKLLNFQIKIVFKICIAKIN